MNGFILSIGNPPKSLDNLRFDALFDSKEAIHRISIGKALFVGWGNDRGDVHFSRSSDDSLLILDGYISEASSLAPFRTQEDACDLLLNIMNEEHSTEYQSQLADHIHGSFSILHLSATKGQVRCISDRVSSRPIWFKKDSKSWLLSSNANTIALLGDKIEYDLGALGAFLLYGSPVEPSKSIYKGIRAVEPGSILTLGIDGSLIASHWYTYQHNPDTSVSYNAWLDLVQQRLKSSAARILNTSKIPMVFLSGGIDSRLTASALRAAGGKPILATLGDSDNLEVKVAKKAGAALGCQHDIIIRDPHWYLRSLPRAVFESTGSFTWTHSHFSEAYRQFQDRYGVDSALLGDFCEAFSKLCCVVNRDRKEAWTPEEFLKEFDTLPLPLYRPPHRKKTLELLRPEARHEVEAQLSKDILARYSRICRVSKDPLIVADHFFRWQSAATITTFCMFLDVRGAGPERSLMFDKDVQDLIEILPSSIRNGANFGAKLISRLWRPASKTVNSNSLLPLGWPNHFHKAAKSVRPIFGKLRRLMFDNSYKTTESFPEKSLLYSSDPAWRSLFDRVLSSRSIFDDNIFDFDAIQACWSDFCKGNRGLGCDVENLVQLGLLTLYVDQKADISDYLFDSSARTEDKHLKVSRILGLNKKAVK